jgi:hypothetical protein
MLDATVNHLSDSDKPFGGNVWKCARYFVFSAGIIFLITAIAKTISAFGKAGILYDPDPFLNISFRHLMLLAALLELLVSGMCLNSNKTYLCLKLVAWLSTLFAVYRIGLWYSGWHRPCICMGTVVDALPIPPQVADSIMKLLLAYLLLGSCVMLLLLRKQNRRTSLRLYAGEVPTARK